MYQFGDGDESMIPPEHTKQRCNQFLTFEWRVDVLCVFLIRNYPFQSSDSARFVRHASPTRSNEQVSNIELQRTCSFVVGVDVVTGPMNVQQQCVIYSQKMHVSLKFPFMPIYGRNKLIDMHYSA